MASGNDTRIDYVRFNGREYVVFDDHNAHQTLARRRLYTDLVGLMGAEPWIQAPGLTLRCIGNALTPTGTGTNVITLNAGGVFFSPAADPGDPAANVLFHRVLANIVTPAASANPGPGDRVDIVTIKVDPDATDAADNESRIVKDAVTGVLTNQNLSKRYRTDLVWQTIEGTPGGGTPATPAGEVKIAEATMLDATAVYDSIDDLRSQSLWPDPGDLSPLTAVGDPTFAVAQTFDWLPIIENGGVQPIIAIQRGKWTRINNEVRLHFQLSWAGGAVASPVVVKPAAVQPAGFKPFPALPPVGTFQYATVAGISVFATTATLSNRVAGGSELEVQTLSGSPIVGVAAGALVATMHYVPA